MLKNQTENYFQVDNVFKDFSFLFRPTNISRARSPNSRPRASSLDPGTLYTCSECRYLTTNKDRYDKHFRQPRHINQYRDRAYKGKK